jgi:hypothetical protein
MTRLRIFRRRTKWAIFISVQGTVTEQPLCQLLRKGKVQNETRPLFSGVHICWTKTNSTDQFIDGYIPRCSCRSPNVALCIPAFLAMVLSARDE